MFLGNGGTGVALLESGKYVYMSGYQASATLLVGATTLTNELSPAFNRAFLAQLDAKTGAPVAASNQLLPATLFPPTTTMLSLDGKVSEGKRSPSRAVFSWWPS